VLVEHHLDLGPLGGEPPHDLRQQARADRLERADAQRAERAALQGGQVGLGRLQAGDDRLGVAQEQPARLGERDGSRAARALDEPLADDPLERLDLLADRGLRVAEPLGGASERPLFGERLERGEVADLDAEPARWSIKFRDGNQLYTDWC